MRELRYHHLQGSTGAAYERGEYFHYSYVFCTNVHRLSHESLFGEVFEWCLEGFGPDKERWHFASGGCVYFAYGADATAFRLRWGGTAK